MLPIEASPPLKPSEGASDTCPHRWVGRPAMCFYSSCSSLVTALADLYCNYIRRCLCSPVDYKFHEAGIHSKI